MERLPYSPPFLAGIRDPEVNRALYEMYQTIAIAVNQIGETTERLRQVSGQSIAAVGEPFGNVAPFTKLWEWNRTDWTQFTYAEAGGTRAQSTVCPAIVSVQPNSVTTQVPYAVFGNGGGSIPAWRGYIYTPSAYAAAGALMIIADVNGGGGTIGDSCGLIFAPAGANPPVNFYQLTFNGAGDLGLSKCVSGTYYNQGNAFGAAFRGNVSSGTFKSRLTILISSTGRVRVYAGDGGRAGNYYECPMTLGNATVWNVVRVGFRIYDQTAVTFSRLALIDVPDNVADQFI